MSDYTKKLHLERRTVLKAGLAGAAALAMPNIARAQSKGTIVVGTWGGDYARLLRKNIGEPILIKDGWEVIQDQANDTPRMAKLLAERRLPHGSTDIQGLNAPGMYRMYNLGVAEKIDYSKIPNAEHLIPSMKFDYGVGHIFSAMTPVYNPDLVEKPKSYKDVFNPKYGDKLAFIDIQYEYTLPAASLAAGGTVTDLDAGKKLLLECRKAGARIYPTNEAFAQGLKAKEFGIGIMWKARVVQWQNAGIKVESVAPSEGGLSYVSGFVVPKNAPHRDGAYAYLNAMLEPSAQEAFAKDMGYNPTVQNAEIPKDLHERIGFSKEEVDNLKSLDFKYMADNSVALNEWWNKEFKG